MNIHTCTNTHINTHTNLHTHTRTCTHAQIHGRIIALQRDYSYPILEHAFVYTQIKAYKIKHTLLITKIMFVNTVYCRTCCEYGLQNVVRAANKAGDDRTILFRYVCLTRSNYHPVECTSCEFSIPID